MAPVNSLPLLVEEPIRLESILEETHDPRPHKCLTKIVGTVGGTSRSPEVLEALLHAGMTAARFDFSSGDLAYHEETLANLTTAMRSTGKICAVICDTVGPEVTIHNPNGVQVDIKEGSVVTLHSPPELPDPSSLADPCAETMFLSIPGLARTIQADGEIFVGQYLFTGSEATSVWLHVKQVDGERIICEAKNGATLRGGFFTVHVSQVRVPVPTLSDRDKASIRAWFQRKNICDILSVSFTRSASDVKEAQELLRSCGATQTQVFAKIENMEGLVNLDGILREADGVILGRGDLGIDLPPEKVFFYQKEAVMKSNLAGKPVIISRVVDTMTDTPRPTRAEATDVANAVLDGVDAIMLGAETLRGLYPVETVATVGSICGEAEKVFNQPNYYRLVMESAPPRMTELESICASAVTSAENVHASCIIVSTRSGETSRLIAKYKPSMPCLLMVIPQLTSNQLNWIFTGEEKARQSQVTRGLVPMLAEMQAEAQGALPSNETMLKNAVEKGKELGIIRSRDRVVVVQRMKNSWGVRVIEAK